MTDNALTPTFSGELQLAGWSESHTGGCKVTFWLQSPDDLAAFRALTVRKGNTAGHRFMAALVEIGDDELPVQPPPAVPVLQAIRERMGDCCYRTVVWCQEPTFWAFLSSKYACVITSTRDAAAMVNHLCCTVSRKELDTNNEANKTWRRLIREPYRVYLAAQAPG